MSVSYKCPNCSANLVFDADRQMMSCEYCGTLISPADIAAQEAILSEEALAQEALLDEKMHTAAVQAEELTGTAAVPAAETKPETIEQTPEVLEDVVQYVCNSCGAAVIADQNTTATFCAFCGSPTIIPERLVHEKRPEFILPFQYGKENAVDSFFAWCKAGRFTPVNFTRKENIEKMTGIYVPFWLFDCEADMNVAAEGKKVSSHTSGNTTTTTTSYYDVVRCRHLDWNMIPFDGARHIDDKLMEHIEPYNYSGLESFDMKYMAGFFADKYDIPADKLQERLHERITNYIQTIFKESTKGYSSISKKDDRSVMQQPNFRYALLPVWILNYKYLGKTYTFAMNGQTGKIAGEPPVSRVKLVILGAAVLPLATCLFRLIGGLLMGGFLS